MGSLAALPSGPPTGRPVHQTAAARLHANRLRQRELYGVPLGDRVRGLTSTLGITQARLARTLGLSPAMLSQLVSARRVKIGDPTVLARLMMLDRLVQRHCPDAAPMPRATSETVLGEVAGAQPQWTVPLPARRPEVAGAETAPPTRRGPDDPAAAVAALRSLSSPARLAAAAATLAPGFPELADALRRAAGVHRG